MIPYNAVIWPSLHLYRTVRLFFRPLYGYGYGVPVTLLAPYSVRPYAVYGTVLSPTLNSACGLNGDLNTQHNNHNIVALSFPSSMVMGLPAFTS